MTENFFPQVVDCESQRGVVLGANEADDGLTYEVLLDSEDVLTIPRTTYI